MKVMHTLVHATISLILQTLKPLVETQDNIMKTSIISYLSQIGNSKYNWTWEEWKGGSKIRYLLKSP